MKVSANVERNAARDGQALRGEALAHRNCPAGDAARDEEALAYERFKNESAREHDLRDLYAESGQN